MTHRIAGLMLAASVLAYAQSGPSFEVASIKPSNSADSRPLFDVQSGGRLTVANFTVKALIRAAYSIRDFQISGAPGWTGSDLFDIAARAEDPADYAQQTVVLRILLSQRFQLVLRRDTREMPVYALVIARDGPKSKDANEPDPNMVDLGGRKSDGWPSAVYDYSPGPVDRGVPGDWSAAPAPDLLGASLFAALQEQPGLRLESRTGPVEMFTIEQVGRPSNN